MLGRLRALFSRKKLDAEMAEEMRHHLELRIERNLAAGMTPEEARATASRSFGRIEQIRELGREERGWRPLDELLQDVRHSGRLLRRRPGTTAVIVLSIGLAIGATTAAFSVINAFLLRSWNDDGMAGVVRVREDFAKEGRPPDVRGFSLSSLGPWRRENTVFEGLAAGTGSSFTLLDQGGRPERVSGGRITANFFAVLGFKPVLGRLFTDQEDQPGRNDVVLLGYGLWQARFGGRPDVLGQTIALNGRNHTVVGVMPRGLRHPYESDLWVPLGYREDPTDQSGVYAPARLKPGVTLERANAELDAMARRLHDAKPDPGTPTGAQVTRLRPEMLGRLNRVLYLLGGAALLVLLIATANVSNLLLAQSLEHGAEAAVRTALGATRARLVRQFIVYSVTLSCAGALVGLALTAWSVRPLVALSPLHGAGEFDIEPRLDWTTLLFTTGLTLLTGVIFGIVPAIWASRANPLAVLRESTRSGTPGGGSHRWLKGIVVAQVALAFVLLLASGAMARGLISLNRAPWGFERENALTFSVAFPEFKYRDGPPRIAFVNGLLQRIRALPEVAAAGATTVPPLWAGSDAAAFNLQSGPAANPRGFLVTRHRVITPGFFDAMRIPIVAGRDFTPADAGGPPVVVVSQSLAERSWPGQSPLGQRLKSGQFDGPSPWMEVIGVAGNVRENDDTEIPGSDAWYLPYRTGNAGAIDELTVVVRSRISPIALVPGVRAAATATDPAEPLSDLLTLDERFARYTATEQLATRLALTLGGIGLFLAAIGVHAVLSFSLGQRRREFGIRAALGATPAQVRWIILRDSFAVTIGGVACGTVAALAARPLLDTSFFPAAGYGAGVVASAIVGIAVVTLLATIAPAIRAGRGARVFDLLT